MSERLAAEQEPTSDIRPFNNRESKNMKHNVMKRVMALAAVVAVSALGFAGTAHAAPGGGSTAIDASELGNITPGTTGSITIHKYEETGNKTELSVSGTSTIPQGMKPLDGVTFSIYPIEGVDVSTVDGFNKATKLSEIAKNFQAGAAKIGNADTGEYNLGTAHDTKATDAQGMTEYSGVPLGAYLVVEKDAPAKVTGKAVPFVVTVPVRDTQANKWQYDVHVYPKNEVSESTKTTDSSQTVKVGDDIKWDIYTKIPSVAAGKKLTKVQIVDALPGTVRYKSLMVGVVDANTKKTNDVELTADTDYKLYAPAADTDGGNASIVLTADGLTKLKNKGGHFVHVNIVATLKSAGDGTIVNKAYPSVDTDVDDTTPPTPPIPDNPPTPPDPDCKPGTPGCVPEVPSNPTYVGKLKITKVDADNTTKTLKGAKFQIFPVKDDGSKADAVMNGADNYFTTNDNGVIEVELSLHEKTTGKFEVVETEAPAGFVMPDDAHKTTEVTLSAGDKADTNYKTIENTPSNGVVPNLPLTGASGRILMLLAGGALVMGAGIAAFKHRARGKQ